MISTIFLDLSLLALACLVLGLIWPAIFNRFSQGITRKKIALIFGGAFVVLFILVAVTAPPVEKKAAAVATPEASSKPSPEAKKEQAASPTPTMSKEQAQKELDDFMNLSKKAALVKSYEFSDTAAVVYVTAVWYTQDAQFKKNFLAQTAELKKALTGYAHFEVHDAMSDEKVAEVTAFGGSLKVYK